MFSRSKYRATIYIGASELRRTNLATQDYAPLAELRHQIRRFVRFSEEVSRNTGLKPQQHQLMLTLKGLPEGVGRETWGRVILRSVCHDLRVAVRWKVRQNETSFAVLFHHAHDVFPIGRNGRLNGFPVVRHPRDREVLERDLRRLGSKQRTNRVSCCNEQENSNHKSGREDSFPLFRRCRGRTPA